ncbi:DUF4704 domain-containing protein [archaeon]|nr:MAG: DUF4704 domain-containing protein [archaeon]
MLFPHDKHHISGHPTEVVHRITFDILSFIQVSSTADNVETWTGEQYLFHARKDWKLKSTAIIAQITSWKGKRGGEISLNYTNKRILLCLQCIVKLCSWKHNVDLILNLFGHGFFGLLFLLLHPIVSQFDELIVRLSDQSAAELESKTSHTVDSIHYLLALMFSIASIPSKLLLEDRKVLYGSNLGISSLPPYRIDELSEQGIDIVLRSVGFHLDRADSVELSELSVQMDPGQLRSLFARSKGPSSFLPAKQKAMDDIFSELIPNLSALLRKLYLLSKISADEGKRNEQGDGEHMDKLQRLVLIVQQEVVCAMTVIVHSLPQLLKDIKSCEGFSTVMAFILCKDGSRGGRLHQDVYGLILRRSIVSIVFHDVCLKASTRQGKGNPPISFIAEVTNMLASLSALFAFIIENMNMEMSYEHVLSSVTSSLINTQVGCSCAASLNVVLPSTDLYPWNNQARVASKFQTLMTGVDECNNGPAFTQALQAYWSVRKSFFPTERKHVFEPSKSYIYAYLTAHLGEELPSSHQTTGSAWLNDPTRALNATYSMTYLPCIFRVLYNLVWRTTELTLECKEFDLFFECTISCFGAMSGNARSIGELGFVLQTVLFLMKSFEKFPDKAAVLYAEKNYWPSLLENILISNASLKGNMFSTNYDANGSEKDAIPLNVGVEASLRDKVYQISLHLSSIPEPKSTGSLLDDDTSPPITPASVYDAKPAKAEQRRPRKGSQSNQLTRLYYYYKLFVADVVFEALWISCTFSGLGETHSDIASQTNTMLGTEIDIVTDFLSNCKNDLAVTYCFRWLSSLVQFVCRLNIFKSLPSWEIALERGAECLKSIAEVPATPKLSLDSLYTNRRLLQWPAKVAVLDFICKLLFTFNHSTWIAAFVPSSSNAQQDLTLHLPSKGASILEGGPDLKRPPILTSSARSSSRAGKHLVLFSLVYDKYCQDYAVPVILRILLACAGSITKPTQSSNHIETNASVTIYDALAHDILKSILNSVKNHSQGSEQEHAKAAKLLLFGLTALLKNPKLFQCEDESLVDIKKIRRLFYTYGTMTPLHKQYFYWSRPRAGIIKDLMICLETSISAETTNHRNNSMYVELVKGSIALLTALTYNSFRFQEALKVFSAQDRRTKVSKVIVNSVVVNNWGINDLGFVILCALEWNQQFYVFFVLIIEMLLNGLPGELIIRAKAAEDHPGTDRTTVEEHAFCGLEESLIIRNTSAVALLSLLLPYFAEREQLYVLKSIIFLIHDCKSSLANITTCTKCKPSLIDYILDALDHLAPAAKVTASHLLRILAQFSVSVSELKRMIRSLRPDRDGGEYFRESSLLLEALRGTIANESDPQFYFLFDGDQSGIVLPSFEAWPGTNGYTFSTWIHTSDWILDSVGNIPIGLSQERTLFSCRQNNGTGVDIFLSLQNSDEGLKLVLCISVFSASRPHIPLKKSICNILTLENENRGKWVYVGLAHSRGTFLSKSQVVAVINAEVYHTELGYPRFTDDPKYACVASLHPVIDGNSSSFRGRMSTIYFFSECLSEQVLLSMYFHGVLRSSELSETFDESIAITPTGSFHDIVVLEYNPSVTTSDLVIDTTIENIQSKWRPLEAFDSKMSPSSMSSGKMHGKLMKGSHVFSSMAMKNALDCLGGSKVLFPLLYNANSVASTATEQHKIQDQFVQMVTMIQNSLDKSPESRRFMVTQGFAFLSLFLENMDPKLISGDLITQLSKFLAFYPDDDEWTRQCLKSLFCNFSLWVLTPFETQEFLLRHLEVHASTKAELFREAVGVNYLFSVLYFQYSEQQLQRYQSISAGKLEHPSWVNRWNQFYSLNPEQLHTIRGLMFQVIYQIVMQSKEDISKEISSIVSYVLHETNGSFKVDGLRLLIKLMNPDKSDLAKRLIDAFVTCKGLLIISHFCNHVRAKVRMYAWLVICNLITLALNCGILQTTAEATKYSSAAESNRRSTILGGSGKRKSFMPASQQAKQVAVESAIDPVFNEKPGQTKVEISVSGNVFSRLGVDESTIAAWFLFLSRSTVEITAQHLLVNENLDTQIHILMQMLILTMFGQMSKFLLSDIEVLPMDVSTDSSPLPDPSSSPSDKYTSNITFDDVFLEPRLLSIPMVFPSLIELFKFSQSSLEKRIVFLQRVTTFIEGMENYDIFMSIPKWQSLLLDVLVAERKQKEIDQHHGASLETLHVLSSTIGTIFTKLHAHSVLCGDLRAPRYHIELPCVLSGPKYKDLDGKELFEMIRRDQRILGCGGIRKTVAFVRSYISAGLLKWDRLCFDMLAMIVEGLHSAIRQVQETAISDVDKDMRLRLFDINTWLTVESVGEFIAMPPVSVASKASNTSLNSMATLAETSPQMPSHTAIRRVASAPPQFDMAGISYDRNVPLSETGIIPQGSSEDMADEPKENSIKVEDGKVMEGIDLITDFDSVILDHFSLPSTMNRRGTFDVLTPALPNEPRLEDEEPITYNFEHAFDVTIWGTVNSMIELLGITGKSLDSWFSHDRLWRLQAGFKVGFVRGRYVIKLVQESADSIMEDFEPSQKGENKNLNGKTHKHLLNRIVDQSIWLLIRILLNFAIQGGADEVGSAAVESVSVQALLKLSQVLIWARTHAKVSYENESLFVLAKLTLAMRAGTAPDNNIWSQLVLKIVDEITISQAKYLTYCLQGYRSEGVAKSLKDFATASAGAAGLSSKMPSFPISPSSFLSNGSEDGQKGHRPSFSFDIRSPGTIPIVYVEDRASFSSDTSQGSLSNYLLGRIDRILQITSRITWTEWSVLMDTQLKVSADREKQLLSSKFDEFGLHKQAREVQSQMEIYVRAVDDAIMYYTQAIGLAVQKLTLNEQKVLKEVIRGEVMSKKRTVIEWQEMYTTLSNERGPWGSGALSDEDVSLFFCFIPTPFLIFTSIYCLITIEAVGIGPM